MTGRDSLFLRVGFQRFREFRRLGRQPLPIPALGGFSRKLLGLAPATAADGSQRDRRNPARKKATTTHTRAENGPHENSGIR
jgi:hypothetical protein